jgi:chromosome segregation protein
MDRGAHFYHCDFQVHTPRDINWTGHKPVSDAERTAYAERFIASCRDKGLDAVAITDHHDFAFFPFIKAAAATETDPQGNEIPAHQKITVFPGMELTLGVPCQAILILDSNFPENLLTSLYPALGITPNDAALPTHAPVTRIGDVNSFSKLCDLLDRIDYLRGRYIILPNVSEGGNSTVLRSGFSDAYKSMPCVGGYLDGSITKLGNGNREILNGKNKEYGFKALGLFQTSDCRRDDFSTLGDHTTWVKWATPTAEALRQACLARSTRISQESPSLPAIVIRSLSVSNSKFLGPIDIDFNEQFNCLIGGRGTGKSTILEYLRWALCDQPPDISDDEIPDFQTKRSGLIEKTLLPLEAVVTVSFDINGVPHLVRRNSRTGELLLKIAASEFQLCSEQDVRDLLPVQAYSQKQLSAVGVRSDELLRFIRASVKTTLADYSERLGTLKSRIRKSYSEMQAKALLQRERERDQLQLQSSAQQVEALNKAMTGISADDRAILDTQEQFVSEEHCLKSWERGFDRVRESLKALAQEVSVNRADITLPPGAERLQPVHSEVDAIYIQAKEHLDSLEILLTPTSPSMLKLISTSEAWRQAFKDHTVQYDAAKQRSAAHESQLRQIAEVDERAKGLREAIAEKGERLSRMGDPEATYAEARAEWRNVFDERGTLLTQKCSDLTQLSGGAIRASLKRGAGMQVAHHRITTVLAGTRVRARRIDDVFEEMSKAADPIHEWNELVDDLEKLAIVTVPDDAPIELPDTPSLAAAGFTSGELEKIARKLTVEEWIEVSLLELEDLPIFEYRIRDGEYISFADASAGQQATALLRVLLNQEGPPLIIDQPEEDLDNQVILEIVTEIWKAKQKRQIVFTSHNANIVVNGDADLVVCCDYRTAGDQSGGRVKAQGAIDIEEMRVEITKIMEGGKDAFRLRKEKYGF